MDQASEELMKESIWCDPLTGRRPNSNISHSRSVDPEYMSGEEVLECTPLDPRPNFLQEFYNTLQNASKKRSNERSTMSSLKKLVRATNPPAKIERNAFRSALSVSSSFDELSASHKTTFESIWNPLEKDYFRMPALTSKEQQYLIRKACQTAQSVVERGRSVGGPITWHYVEKYKGVQVYRGKARTSRLETTMCMCGVTRVPGTVKEVASLFNMASTRKMRHFGQVFPEFFQDGLVLYPLQEPTKQNNLNQIAAKWMVLSCPPPLRSRDFCVLECQDRFVDTFGRKGWVLSMHSIKLPGCHELSEEFGLCRASIYQSGVIITNAEHPYHVDILHIVQINLKSGDAAPYGMLRERVACISRLYDILRGKRLNEQRYLGDLALVSKKTRSRCFVCRDPFHLLLLRKLNCRKCGEVVCSACSKEFDLVSREDLSSHYTVRICLHCYKIITTASGCLANPSRRERRTSSKAVSNHRTRSRFESTNNPYIGYRDDAHLAATQTQASPSPRHRSSEKHPIEFRQSHHMQHHGEDTGSDIMLSSSLSNPKTVRSRSSREQGSQFVALASQRITQEQQVDQEQHRDTIRFTGKDGNEMRQRSKNPPNSPKPERGADGMPWSIFDRQDVDDGSSFDSNGQMLHADRPPRMQYHKPSQQSRDVDHSFDLDNGHYNYDNGNSQEHIYSPTSSEVNPFGQTEKQENIGIWEKQEQFSRQSAITRPPPNTHDSVTREQCQDRDSGVGPFTSKLYGEEETKSADFIDSVPTDYVVNGSEDAFKSLQNCPSSLFSNSGINSMLLSNPTDAQDRIDEISTLDQNVGDTNPSLFEQFDDTNHDRDSLTCLDEFARLGVPQDSPNAASLLNPPLQSETQDHYIKPPMESETQDYDIKKTDDQPFHLESLDGLVEHSRDSVANQAEIEQVEQLNVTADSAVAVPFEATTEEPMKRSSIDQSSFPFEVEQHDVDIQEDVSCSADTTCDRTDAETTDPMLPGDGNRDSLEEEYNNGLPDLENGLRLSFSSDEGEMGVDSESEGNESLIDSQSPSEEGMPSEEKMRDSFSQVEIHRVKTHSALEYHV
uniref:Uncharacterized protein AlNc14C48G3846 n=1 Tax=Albugo laibachii Nc14 TaxID=890382 RepID=F0WAY5_9STRA|nr:conserved hypothetical protein [Albugo laibachii Nc14]CCA18420.1 conserved hypothetical protein [Albugo laibachii Nc14]|eukprot:CCA18420.1 conserved hypothetical protein [Albugo laibachii Nc14]